MKPTRPILSIAAALAMLPAGAFASINFTGGGADLTFFYESAADTWHTILREKGDTTATGLDNQFAGFTGIVDLRPADYTFSSLTTQMVGLQSFEVNGTDYFIFSANGSGVRNDGTADLGIRTRLRENQLAMGIGTDEDVVQFDNLRLTLNLADSTFASPTAEFAMFSVGGFGNLGTVLYETADNNLEHDWPASGHSHWHWGFSEVGDYTLVFDIEGIGGIYGGSASTGQVAVNFAVPEPSMAAALMGLVALMTTVVGRRRRH